MKLILSARFLKIYKKLPKYIQLKVDKQLRNLVRNFFHPSFNTKKMEGEDRWEFRIDRKYRMTGKKTNDELILTTVGPHDEGLGKK